MSGLTLQDPLARSETLKYAQKVLSGKRVALLGFGEKSASGLAQIITEADGFTRSLSLSIDPTADVLKPFELILIDVESAQSTAWLQPEEPLIGLDRCVAVGTPAALLALAAAPSPQFYREYCVWPASQEHVLLRCVLALRPGSSSATRAIPLNSTVVLADDDPSITALVRLLLQRNGMTCEIASTGGEALKRIEQLRPCAAVLDIGMPDIDGFEVLSRLRSIPELAQTGVILLTGSEQETDIVRGFRLGADDYVIKPFSPMELMMRLKRVIGRI